MSDLNHHDRHGIRLRGPWWWSCGAEYHPERASRIKLPTLAIDSKDEAEDFVFRRPFNAPTGILPTDSVWLVLVEVENFRAVFCNGRCLLSCPERQAAYSGEWEITKLLRPLSGQRGNQLDLRITLPCPGPPSFRGEVRLEIEATVETSD